MQITGFETKTKKETKSDLLSFADTKENYNKKLKDVDVSGNYSGACDGYRAVLTGDIENFKYQNFDEETNFTLNLLKKALPDIEMVKKDYNRITVNFNAFYQAIQLFAKNMKYSYMKEITLKTSDGKTKTKQIKINSFRLVIIKFTETKLHLNFDNTEMAASFEADNRITKDIERVGFNPQYLLDGLKLLKNRKLTDSVTLYVYNEFSPAVIITENIYMMLLPVRVCSESN